MLAPVLAAARRFGAGAVQLRALVPNRASLRDRLWRDMLAHDEIPEAVAEMETAHRLEPSPERAADQVYTHPLDVCDATTQGEIGYLLQQSLQAELAEAGLTTPVATVVTQVVVFLLKVLAVCSFQILVRWSLPRFRYDQVLAFAWKFMLPLALINLSLTAVVVWSHQKGPF